MKRRSVVASAAVMACTCVTAGSLFGVFSQVPSAEAARKRPAAVAKPSAGTPTTSRAGTGASTTTSGLATSGPTTIAAAAFDPCAVRIMPLGDSITGFPDGYRGPLYRRLRASRLAVDLVGSVAWDPTGGGDPNGEGHGGFTIGPDSRLDADGKPGNLAQRVDEWVAAADPDIVMLQIGTNDLGAGNDFVAQAPARLAALVAHLGQIAPNAWILLGTLIPIRGWKEGRPEVQVYNDAIRALGSARADDRVVTAELWDSLAGLGYDTERDTADGTHPNAAGGEKMAAAWLPWLLPMIDRKATATCK